ncbi:MAG: MurR/RpiR family transcriptional regulator [Phycisphaerales bacterium]
MSIQDLIATVSDRLTPTERRIAEVILEDPTLLAFGTVSDLATRVDTSRPSIVRFATKLGFAGYPDLQNSFRDEFTRTLTSPSQRIRQKQGAFARVRQAIEQATHRTFDALEEPRLTELARPIYTANAVWILSGETSMAGAHALHSGLAMIRANVHLVEEHDTGRDLTSAARGDVAVVFDFTRYRRNSITAARALNEMGVDIVAVTDGPLSPLASIAKVWCELKIPAVGPFDSSVPAVLSAELIVAKVVGMIGDDARERIDRLESMWQATGTFLEYTPRRER